MSPAPRPELSPLQRRKRAAILSGAQTVFLTRGYGSTTMDEVAAAARVNKQTVHRHFASKEALFESLIAAMCVDGAGVDAAGDDGDLTAEERLCDLGHVLVRNPRLGQQHRLYRAVVAESGRRPDLGRLFFEQGAKLVQALAARILATVFDEETAAVRASTFISVVLGDAHLELTLGYRVSNRRARFAAQIEEAIQAALRD